MSGHSALSVPAFRLYLTARGISWAGNAVSLVALPILVFQLSDSPALTSLVAAIEVAPYLLLGLLAGALADRWDRRSVLISVGLARGAVLAIIPVAAVVDALSVPLILLVAVVVSSLFVLFDAASFGAVPEMVGRERIASATSAMMSLNTTISILGPAVGGILVSTVGAASAVAVDAVAYLLAAGLTWVVRWPQSDAPAPDRLGGSLRSEMAEGVRFVWEHRVIRLLTLIGAGASVSTGAVAGLIVVAGVANLGLTSDDDRLGLLFSATAAGSLISAITIGRFQRRLSVGHITLLALTASATFHLAWSFTTTFALALIVLAAFQFAATVVTLNGIIVRQTLAPDRLQARVNTIARMIAWGGTPLGAILGGMLAEHLAVSTALALCSIGTLTGLCIAIAGRARTLPRLEQLRS